MIFLALLVVVSLHSLAECNPQWTGPRGHDFLWDAHSNPLTFNQQPLPADYVHVSPFRPEMNVNHPNAPFEQFYYPTKQSLANTEMSNVLVEPKLSEHNENELLDARHRRPRFQGMKGEINIKWMVKPIADFKPKAVRPDEEDNHEEAELHRDRRQVSNWNLQPLFKRMFAPTGTSAGGGGGNLDGLLSNFGRKITRQVGQGSDQMMTGVFQSVQDNFKRLMRLNVAQILPKRLF